MPENLQNSFIKGARDGIPIALGYLSVSVAVGISAVSMGIPVWGAVLISLLNVTSAGEVAGMPLIVAGAPLIEMALTQLVINLRYALMSLTLTQKLDPALGTPGRMAVSFGITDEIFAMASSRPEKVGGRYMAGLITVPVAGWTLGTFIGAAASSLLPPSLRSALGIAIYGMFIAIVLPPAVKDRAVRVVALTAAVLSSLFAFAPVFEKLSSGFAVILAAVAASALGAFLFPLKEEDDSRKEAD